MMVRCFAVLGLLGTAACSQQETAATNNAADTNVTANAAAEALPVRPKSPDQAFVDTAAANDSFAMAAGNLAKVKAARPEVKSFGARVFDEHVQSSMRLKAAAAKLPDGGLVDPTLTPELLAHLATLQKAEGAAFDRTFVSQQLALHERAMTAMRDYVATGGNDALKEYADYNSRRIRSRLDRLREL